MEILIVGMIAIFFIIIVAMYLIAKLLNVKRLFYRAFLTFTLIVMLLGGITYFFIVEKEKETYANEEIVFSEQKPFAVGNQFFAKFPEAVAYAQYNEGTAPVFFRNRETIVWEKKTGIPEKVIQVPLILQLPELGRGAEVTSLAMLLNYAGIKVSKLELAAKVKKDRTPLRIDNGTIYYGNPNDGFVGDIYSTELPGLGVFHGPITALAETYLPEKIVDMTGAMFEDILYPIHNGHPVWALIHTQFRNMPDDEWQTWMTPSGEIQITQYQHAVLITGFDERNIYYNDPLSLEVNRPILKEQFKEAWVQMGRQAITYAAGE